MSQEHTDDAFTAGPNTIPVAQDTTQSRRKVCLRSIRNAMPTLRPDGDAAGFRVLAAGQEHTLTLRLLETGLSTGLGTRPCYVAAAPGSGKTFCSSIPGVLDIDTIPGSHSLLWCKPGAGLSKSASWAEFNALRLEQVRDYIKDLRFEVLLGHSPEYADALGLHLVGSYYGQIP